MFDPTPAVILAKLESPHLPFSRWRQWSATALTCILTVIMLGANPATDPSARYNRLGHNMMCVCSCGQILLECNHVGCPDSARMTGELRDQTGGPSSGKPDAASDKAVYQWFEAKYGATVLAAPIRGGFDNLAWILPFSLFVLAIFGTALVVRLWAQRRRLDPATAAAAGPISSDAVRDRIRRETEWQ